MSFPINLVNSSQVFKDSCTQLNSFGNEKSPRIKISKTQFGFIPVAVQAPSWIEKILRFFRYKDKSLRLHQVANFSLNWLRAHALQYNSEFHENIRNIEKLRPLMKKAGLEQDFNKLLSSTDHLLLSRENSDQLFQVFEQRLKAQIGEKQAVVLQKIEEKLERSSQLEEKAKEVFQHAGQKLDESRRTLTLQDFKFSFPRDIGTITDEDALRKGLNKVLTLFLERPGTMIKRIENTRTIVLEAPEKEHHTHDFPLEIDFFIEGAIPKRRIVIKTEQVIGEGGDRVVKRAFDLLNNEELVSKPFTTRIEKFMVEQVHKKNLAGFLPLISIQTHDFYEKRCESLYDHRNASEVERIHLMQDLAKGLNSLHAMSIPISIQSDSGRGIHNFPVYHGDIKPENIMVFKDKKTTHAGISDFGSICQITKICYSVFFRDPEKIQFCKSITTYTSEEAIIDFNLKNARACDVWAMGLVFATILSGWKTLEGYDDKYGVPDLECFRIRQQKYLKDRVKKGKPDSAIDMGIENLRQKEIDDSIDKLAGQPSKHLKPMWSLVKAMLQVESANRIKASQLRHAILPS